MKFTEADKKYFTDLFSTPFGKVECIIDGAECAFEVRRERKELKFCVAPFVNGQLRYAWFLKENMEFGQRLLRPVKKQTQTDKGF